MNVNCIFKNFPGSVEYSRSSFVGIFHEECVWDDNTYVELEDALYELSEKHKNMSSFPRQEYWPAMRIYSYLANTLGCHFDPNDGFKLQNLSIEQVCNRRDRLQQVFEGLFKGEMPERRNLGS